MENLLIIMCLSKRLKANGINRFARRVWTLQNLIVRLCPVRWAGCKSKQFRVVPFRSYPIFLWHKSNNFFEIWKKFCKNAWLFNDQYFLDFIPKSIDFSNVFGYNIGNRIREDVYADRKERIFRQTACMEG